MPSSAFSLVVPNPVLVTRSMPSAILKYQVDTTSCAAPEGIIMTSHALASGVLVREELESTAINSAIIY